MLLSGEVDGVLLYASQAEDYHCQEGLDYQHSCDLWSAFGEHFAYVQTGLYSHAINGTTLVMSKKGSGIAEIINPMI